MNRLIDRLNRSKSVFHAADEIVTALTEAGFTRLNESSEWKLEKGKGYFVTRNLSSVIAFRVPEGDFGGFMLTASHLDSPVFKIKENAEIEVKGKYIQLDTERYGGQILLSWLDRPLSFAGRVAVRTDKGVETRLIDEDRDSLVIMSSSLSREGSSLLPVPMQEMTGTPASRHDWIISSLEATLSMQSAT